MTEPTVRGLGSIIHDAVRDHGVGLAAYVADHLLSDVTDAIKKAPDIHLVTAAREDEGLGVLAGAYMGGRRGIMLMQSSGFALCMNALGSMILPYQIPIPMIVGLRGDLGEFNVAQIVGGQSVEPTCRTLGIPYEAPTSRNDLAAVLDGMLKTSYSTHRPVCIGIRRSLTS